MPHKPLVKESNCLTNNTETYSIDVGRLERKTKCGAHVGEAKTIHRLSAFATGLGLLVGGGTTSGKSNEITVIP